MITAMYIENSALTPSKVQVFAQVLEVNGKRQVDAKPNANTQTTPVRAQTLAWENPIYRVSSIQILSATNTLQQSHILALYRQAYNNSNASILTATAGNGPVLNCLGHSTGIRVVLEDFSIPFSMTDSNGGYIPTASLTFLETG